MTMEKYLSSSNMHQYLLLIERGYRKLNSTNYRNVLELVSLYKRRQRKYKCGQSQL